MGKFDNLNDSQITAILGRLDRLERASPVNNTAIGRGGIEVYDGGVINVSNGGLNVVGSGTFNGTLYANGTIAFTGTLTQSGPSTFTGDTKLNGPTHINGATDITGTTTVTGDMTSTGTFTNNGPTNLNGTTKTTGTLEVDGVTTLKADLNVTTGGNITAGNTKISPSASNGGIEFISGGGVGGNGGAVSLKGTGNAGVISNASMTSAFAGSNSIDVDGSGITVNGTLKTPGLTSTASAANVYFDPTSKQLFYKP